MFRQIFIKEIKEQLYTWKSTLWLLITSLVLSFTSYLLLTDKELSLLDQTEMLWLLSKIVIGIGFLIVAIDASSIITSEFEKGTAESLFLAPIRLRDIILGKLLSSMALWFSIFCIAIPYMIVTSLGTKLTLAFIFYIGFWGTIGATSLVILIFAISLLYRSSKNTLTTSLIMVLAGFIPAFFSLTMKSNPLAQFLTMINPIDNIFSSLDNILVDYHLSLLENFQYILPVFIFFVLAIVFLLFGANQFKRKGIITAE